MATNSAQQFNESARVWRFADCEFDELSNQLVVRGAHANVEAKPLEVLRQLLVHAGEVVTKEELLETVWPGLMVVDGSLATAISKLRKALANESIVLTVPRIGYRVAVPVQASGPGAASGPELHMQGQTPVPGRKSWILERRLDMSPSSEVWLARHPKTGELRVFKFAADAARLKALKREVTLARLLRESLGERHDFVRILEWNFETAPYYLESEYAGPNLAEWAQSQGGMGKVPMDLRLAMLAEIAQAIADAHALGVLHKDIKPANILVATTATDEPQVKIADFGSGALLDASRLGVLAITNSGFTQTEEPGTSALTGTALYVAPEVLSGQSPSNASDVYALGVLLYQFIVGEFRRPLAPGWEHDIEDPVLRQDIADAAAGDPARRLASAEEFARRLRTLESRRAQQAEGERHERRRRKIASLRARAPWMLVALAALLFAFEISFRVKQRPTFDGAHAGAVAVLPFQNPAGQASLDSLRFALADELTTALSHMQPLKVRPFDSQWLSTPGDFRKIAGELAVGRIVTGQIVILGDRLEVTIEAVDPDRNTVVWRDTIHVARENLLGLEAQVSAIARNKLAPALGAPDFDGNTLPIPKNAEAYKLYVDSAFPSTDAGPTKQAIAMLEKAVALDPTYAPAWSALSGRLYGESRFAGGGRAVLDRADEAAERAIALDPSDVNTASELTIDWTERGELERALREAEQLLERRPDVANLHHLMSYVLRYGGLLDESVHQCDVAIEMEHHLWSPCAITYTEAGDYARAMSQLRPGLASEWSRAVGIDILMREGKTEDALRLRPPTIPGWQSYRMLLACAGGAPAAEIRSLASSIKPDDDPEVTYLSAAHLAYCGQTSAAVRMLQTAVDHHYCSYPAVDHDPLFDKIRKNAEFLKVRQSALACETEFRREEESLAASSASRTISAR
jgi:serine/threonine protein kinase/DNA-binding winged helix-turn-helix (wHTH) protein